MIGPEGASPVSSALNELMWDDWEYRWVGPMVRSGISRDTAVSVVATIHSSSIAMLLAMHQGRLRRSEAELILAKIIDAVVDPSWKITRTTDK